MRLKRYVTEHRAASVAGFAEICAKPATAFDQQSLDIQIAIQLRDLDIDEGELCDVVNSALVRVTPDYAATKLESCSVTELNTPSGSSLTVVLLHVTTQSGVAARGQYAPLTEDYDRGFVDEYLFGVIHGHWLATYGRDLFHELEFVVDVRESGDAPRLYRFIDINEARARQLVSRSSPVAVVIQRYDLRQLPLVGGCLAGPSPGMVEMVAHEVERLGRPRMLDLFAGSCALARVALEHGAQRAICLDTMIDEQVAAQNLGPFAPQAELRRQKLASGLGDEKYDLVAIDPFYDETLIAFQEFIRQLNGRFQSAVINLGLSLPTAWQRRIESVIQDRMAAMHIYDLHGERIAVCQQNG